MNPNALWLNMFEGTLQSIMESLRPHFARWLHDGKTDDFRYTVILLRPLSCSMFNSLSENLKALGWWVSAQYSMDKTPVITIGLPAGWEEPAFPTIGGKDAP